MLLDYIEQVLAIRVGDLLAAGKRHPRTMHRQKRFAIDELDVEAVPRDGEDLFAKDYGLYVLGYKLVEESDRLGDGLEGRHGCGVRVGR